MARLAGSLFDQLQKVHRLDAADRRMLLAAAVLHDVGIFIGHKKHHKHSLYVISQSEIPEFTPREIAVIANVARYHRKGVPAVHHEPFTGLESEDRERVVKLASILRIADALDREHLQAVRGVKATRGEEQAHAGAGRHRRPAAGALGPAPQSRPLRRHLRPGGGGRRRPGDVISTPLPSPFSALPHRDRTGRASRGTGLNGSRSCTCAGSGRQLLHRPSRGTDCSASCPVPPMTIAEINELASAGESETIEFKRTTGQRTDGARAVCGMLNGIGGFVFFGVEDDGRSWGRR